MKIKPRNSLLFIGLMATGVLFAENLHKKIWIERLGRFLYEDSTLSLNGNQSCMSCHHPNAGFSDPVNRISPKYRQVSEGSVNGFFGPWRLGRFLEILKRRNCRKSPRKILSNS